MGSGTGPVVGGGAGGGNGWGVVFADGAGHAFCRREGVMAVTAPGNRVVYVCTSNFSDLQARDPATAEAVLLHESLHTLGLEENPPTSLEITKVVTAHCAA